MHKPLLNETVAHIADDAPGKFAFNLEKYKSNVYTHRLEISFI